VGVETALFLMEKGTLTGDFRGEGHDYRNTGGRKMKDISDLLGCRQPIIQGAMATISNPEMVAAVSEAGGYGLLAAAFLTDPENLKEQIRATQRLTNKPFGVNLAAINPKSLEFSDIIAEMGIRAVTTSAGFSKAVIDYLKGRGVKVLHVVANVKGALMAEEAGVDAVIAEGTESGGLQGHEGVSNMVLIPLVVAAVGIPVVAAGGIGDSRGFGAAFALGAKGVQVGTRFIASHECIAHINFKKSICDAKETDTVLFGSGRLLARVIRTPFVEKTPQALEKQSIEDVALIQKKTWIDGDLTTGTFSAGQIAGMVNKVKSVREIIEEMVH